MSVRILTYNIHHGADARNRPSLHRIAGVIADSGAEIVCLQEVDRNFGARSGHVDQVAVLTDRLGMHGHFGAALSRRGGHYGNAILSRGAMCDTRVHDLPTPEDIEPRRAVAATVSTDIGPLHVVSVHLTVGPDMGAVRRRQVSVLVDTVAAMAGPVVVAGDFNTGARRQLSEIEHAMSSAGSALRWSPARLGLLWGRPYAATFPVRAPRMRIDRIYVTGLRVRSLQVLPDAPSDHRALLIEATKR